ncbi:MAG: UDP-N-acetylmuramoyl-tripeptide--D-alanyl-D-alanine ligase [Clostridiales Family XIII bacterium]|jgi:UDP-N-acetylmuramoyl-tripeptide--D-alanyl-D-alanine ligase|nr:UDP-N-acetylmuramoyl-tripeptide--D-alanyl-D-alanine ligase [Clostridiales Family XIII bacterium]
MKAMTLGEICAAVDGDMDPSFAAISIGSVSTDSRKIGPAALFVAIRGGRFDGHDFIEAALAGGAAGALSSGGPAKGPVVRVGDTRLALMALAAHYRRKFSLPVVAVTGSTGKTSVKDFIASALSESYATLKTEGNLNNELGLPLTVFGLDEGHGAMVLEMGMSQLGEIGRLGRVALPDICVITNIGLSHAGSLGGREGVLKAKSEILGCMREGGRALLWSGDDMLRRLRGRHAQTYYYGDDGDADFRCADIAYLEGLSGMSFSFSYPGAEGPLGLRIPVPGRHMALNATAAAAVGTMLGVPAEGLRGGLARARLTGMRLDVKRGGNGVTLIDDSYNASPDSMAAALDVLSQAKGRRVAILGDMLELGDFSREGHEGVGRMAAEKGVALLLCVGEAAAGIREGYTAAGGAECRWFPTAEACSETAPALLARGDAVLVKASRAMGLERVAASLL